MTGPGGPTPEWSGWLGRVSSWFAVEPLTRDREDELAEFFMASYGDQPVGDAYRDDQLVRRRIRWIGEGHPAWVCLQQNRIVGHFGALAADVVVDGRVVPACWGRDLIVAPAARRLGAGPALVMTAVRAAPRPFMVAGLNDESYALCRGLGFLDNGRIPLFVNVLDAGRLMDTVPSMLGRRPAAALVKTAQFLANRRRRRGRSIGIAPVGRFDETFDRWWAGVERAVPCVVRRTSATMRWRYREHPWHEYHCFAAHDGAALRGIVVVRSGRSRGVPAGFISELLADPRDGGALDALVAHAVEWLTSPDREPPAFLRCAVLNAAVERALRRAGFLPVPKSPMRWMLIHPAGAGALGPLVDRGRWFLTSGDSDLDLL